MTQATEQRGEVMRLTAQESARLTARITWLSVGVGLSLMLVKGVAWWTSGSVSLLASTADSGLDFVAALGAFWGVRKAVEPADSHHRFGHGKIEAFASLFQAGLVLASAVLVAREAIGHLLTPEKVRADATAIGVMVVSVLLTLGLLKAQASVISKTRSVAIEGDRAHYTADLVSNVAAIFGIGLVAWTGQARWDALAGLMIAVWLVKGAVDVLRSATDQLLDREMDDVDRDEVLRLAMDDEEVFGVHQFRSRVSGPYLHVQLHMELDPEQPLLAAHDVVERAEQRILLSYPNMDLVIHADPFGLSEDHDVDFDGLPVGRVGNPRAKGRLTTAKAAAR